MESENDKFSYKVILLNILWKYRGYEVTALIIQFKVKWRKNKFIF